MENQDLMFSLSRLLQRCSGPTAKVLAELNRACLSGRWRDDEADHRLQQIARETLHSRAHAQTLLSAHGKTIWPGSFGQSPYGEIFALVRLALAGQMPLRGASNAERAIHTALFDFLAPPAAVKRVKLNNIGRAQRYARVLFAMRETAMLSYTEADATLRLLLNTHPGDRSVAQPSCEAVAHFGGNLRVLTEALRRRAHLRVLRAREAALT